MSGSGWEPAREIRDEGFVLRAPTAADVPAVMAVYCDHPDTLRFVAFQAKTDEGEAARFLDVLSSGWEQARPAWFCEADSGVVGCVIAALDGDAVEISYTMSPDSWGKGHATRAVGLVVAECFRDSSVASIHATCDAQNLASMRVLEKAGFEREALLEAHGRHNISTELRDCVRFRRRRAA